MRLKPINRKTKILEKALLHIWKVYESCFNKHGKIKKGNEWLVHKISKVQDDIRDINYQLENGVFSHLNDPELLERFVEGKVSKYDDDWS